MGRNASLLLFLCVSPFHASAWQTTPPGAALARHEAVSLLGTPLVPPELPPAQQAKLLEEYERAKADADGDPGNVEKIIWLGRRAAYLWRYREAIDLFSRGMEISPKDPRLYRHRGHRFISVREFARAEADLRKAADLASGLKDEVEPDGQPNAMNIPTSTLKSNIWYHLGLAHYLQGEFQEAEEAFRECLKYSGNDDMLCATNDWLYMTLRRLGRTKEAEKVLSGITSSMNIIENFSYHRRLLMYKGILPADSLLRTDGVTDLDLATQGYGVANWHLYNERPDTAHAIFRRILEGSYWAAFGYIAAEAELARMRTRQ